MSDPKDVHKGNSVELPAGQFTVGSEHEAPTGDPRDMPAGVGITSQQADIGFAGGQHGQRTGPMETGSERRERETAHKEGARARKEDRGGAGQQ